MTDCGSEGKSVCHWFWQKDPADAAADLLARGMLAIKENHPRATRGWQYASLFEGMTLSLPSTADRRPRPQVQPISDTPIIRNRVRAVVQTWISKLTAGDSPLPQFMTTDADWELRRKAVMGERAVESEMEEPTGSLTNQHELWRHAATIAAVVGSAAVYYGVGPDGSPCT